MKRKLSAVLYTLFLIVTVLLSPIFFEWYTEDLLGRTNDIESIPFAVWMLSFFLFFGQLALACYLWARVLDKTIK